MTRHFRFGFLALTWLVTIRATFFPRLRLRVRTIRTGLAHQEVAVPLTRAHNRSIGIRGRRSFSPRRVGKINRSFSRLVIPPATGAMSWPHKSFENEEVAAIMNREFVNIKVTGKERPDVDRVYMTICAGNHGGGRLGR